MENTYNKLDHQNEIPIVQRRILQMKDQAGYKSLRALAKAIKEAGSFGEMTEESIYKAIQNHTRFPDEKGSNSYRACDGTILPTGLTVEHAIGYCNFFSCSFEYLLGKTEVKTPDSSVQAICKRLSLSEEAVYSLEHERYRKAVPHSNQEKIQGKTFNFASPILSHPKFRDIAWSFHQLQNTWDSEPTGWNIKKLAADIGEERFAAAVKADDFIPEADDPDGLLPPPLEQERDDCSRYRAALDADYKEYGEWCRQVRLCKYELSTKIAAILDNDFPVNNP